MARWPGSTHDQRIFNNSRLKYRLEHGELGRGFVVADAGYENRPYMLTPLTRTTNREENLFNESIIRTRNPVERTYDVMKRRFPVLAVGLRCSVNLAMFIIQAVVVLHNISLRDPLPHPDIDIGVYEDAKVIVERASIGQNNAQRRLVNQYFSNLPSP